MNINCYLSILTETVKRINITTEIPTYVNFGNNITKL